MDATELLAGLVDAIEREKALRAAFAAIDFRGLRGDRTQTSMSYAAQVPQSALSLMEKGTPIAMSLDTMARVLRAYAGEVAAA